MASQRGPVINPADGNGNPTSRTMRMESVSQILPADRIESRLAALPTGAPKDRSARTKEAARVLKMLSRSLLLALSGVATIAVFVWLRTIAADGVDDLLEVVSWFPLMFGVVAPIGAVVAIVRALRRLRNPGLTAPQGAFKTFYTELGIPEIEPEWLQPKSTGVTSEWDVPRVIWAWVTKSPETGSVYMAWRCLDAVAQAEHGSIDGFERHWNDRMRDMRRQVLGYAPSDCANTYFASGPAQVREISERVAEAIVDVAVMAYDEVEVENDSGGSAKRKVVHAVIVWPQSKTLLKGGDRWYLTSGTLDGPLAEARLRSERTDARCRSAAPASDLASLTAGIEPADGKVAELLALFQDQRAWLREFGIWNVTSNRLDDPRIIAALQILAASDSVDSIRRQAAEALDALPQSPGSGELRAEDRVHV